MKDILVNYLKWKKTLRLIEKEINQETNTLAKQLGIRKNSPTYQLLRNDVINGKPTFMGCRYVGPTPNEGGVLK